MGGFYQQEGEEGRPSLGEAWKCRGQGVRGGTGEPGRMPCRCRPGVGPAPSTCAEAGLALAAPSLSSVRYDDIPAPPRPPCVVPVIWDQGAPKPDHRLALTDVSPLPVR